MRNTLIAVIAFSLAGVTSCTETEGVKRTFDFTDVAGEYVVTLDLTQPFEASEEHTIRIYNTASDRDSLWVEDEDFFGSKVKVRWEQGNTFSAVAGEDVLHGEVVNITGEVFPEKDSVHIEWRYLQGGEPEDDYIVIGNGVLYNGLTN